MIAAGGFTTFRELDRELDAPKGTAFRAFKRVRSQLVEDRDFTVLDADRDRADIDALRRNGRIYPVSVNVVLLAPAAARRIHADASR